MSDKQLTKKSEKIQDILTESGLLTDYVLQRDNQAINFTGERLSTINVTTNTIMQGITVVRRNNNIWC